MSFAQMIALANSWGMHNGDIGVGWLIIMVPMMLLMMGGMMWMMMRAMGSGPSGDSSDPSERRGTTESPVEILERRFAEGEIPIEEYRARRAELVNGTADVNGTGDQSGHPDEAALTAPRAGEVRS